MVAMRAALDEDQDGYRRAKADAAKIIAEARAAGLMPAKSRMTIELSADELDTLRDALEGARRAAERCAALLERLSPGPTDQQPGGRPASGATP